jgi:predicted N-formylglutamate amidohydrolase
LITGNQDLSHINRAARIAAIHAPYHLAISDAIAARQAAGRETILLALHSFTPVLNEIARAWAVGVLHWTGRVDFAISLLDGLRRLPIEVGNNAPYAMDATDYSVPRHAFPLDLRYAEIEVRQDLIEEPDGQTTWARKLRDAARDARRRLA